MGPVGPRGEPGPAGGVGIRLQTFAAFSLVSNVSRPEPIMLFDKPNSAPLVFEVAASGTLLVTFSTVVTGSNGGSPFEWLLWVDDGPAPTMPAPATVTIQAGGTPVSSTQVVTLPPGSHLVQVVVRSPGGQMLTLSHSHLTALWIPSPAP
jgi:hypothetical protein